MASRSWPTRCKHCRCGLYCLREWTARGALKGEHRHLQGVELRIKEGKEASLRLSDATLRPNRQVPCLP